MPTILVVDDSAVDRRLVGGLLSKSSKLNIRYAVDGAEALRSIEVSVPDVIVTDLIMPNLNGLGLVAKVVAKYPKVPVILMTGQGSQEIAAEALQIGATSYVPKTALAQILLETVERLADLSASTVPEDRLMVRMIKNELSFKLENDMSLIPALVNYLHSCLQVIGLTDASSGMRVCVALEEALNNAIFHGNLELSSDVREDQELHHRLMSERRVAQPYCERFVSVDASFTRQDATFCIRDQGPGFDPAILPDPTDPANLERACGRGVMLMKTFMDHVTFNKFGNEVTLIKNIDGSAVELAAS